MTSSIRLKRNQSQELLDNLYGEDNYYWYLSCPQYHDTFLTPLAEECLMCGDSVLDIGCGRGQLAIAMNRHVSTARIGRDISYTGFDASTKAVDFARDTILPYLSAEFLVDRFEDFQTSRRFNTVVFGNILSVLVWQDSHLDLIRRYLEMTLCDYFIVYELERFPTHHIQKEFRLVNDYHLEVDMAIDRPKRKRKIEVYEV